MAGPKDEDGGKLVRAVGGEIRTDAKLAEAARSYATVAKAERTRRAYASDWRGFTAWCQARSLPSLPADQRTVAFYLTDRAERGRKVSKIVRALAAIAEAHKIAGHAAPRSAAPVQEVVKGIRRRLGVAPEQKAPLVVEQLRAILASP